MIQVYSINIMTFRIAITGNEIIFCKVSYKFCWQNDRGNLAECANRRDKLTAEAEQHRLLCNYLNKMRFCLASAGSLLSDHIDKSC